ncbi:MAG: RepB family plasmid replication initiator protein [Methylovulum sp.]|nr:RepB family plasmid replication initiator protein [Methylovulum sp.]
MSEKTLVVQHNKLVEARYKLTLEEQRLIKMLVSQIQPNDDDFKAYEIHVLDITKLLGITDDYYYNKIKKLTKKLRDSSLCFTNENGDEIQTGWLSSAIYRKGKGAVELRFDPVLKPYLLQLKSLFTSYELGNILCLRGMYSIRFYELLKQYEKIGKREFPLDEFKRTLMLEDKYKQYKELKKYVLLPSQIEVCEKTDIAFSIEEKTQGRKVTGLIFHIKGKERHRTTGIVETDTDVQVIEQTSLQLDFDHIQDKIEEGKAPDNKYIQQLIDMGVTRVVAVQLAKEFGGERIDRAIAYTKEKQKEGHVKKQAAFVVVAIQRDFIDPQAEERARGAEILRLHEEREKLKKRWEEIKTQYGKWKAGAVELALLEMTTEEVEEEKRQFMDSINGVMRSAIQKNKQSEKRHFLLYLREKLSLDTLEAWAQKNAVDLSAFPDEIRG